MPSPASKSRIASAFILTACFLAVQPLHAQSLRDLADMHAPPEMLAAYTCAGIAVQYIGPEIEKRAVDMLKGAQDRQAVMRTLLQDYDDQAQRLCHDILPAFQRQPALIFKQYAKQEAGYVPNQAPWLLDARRRRWLKDTNEFQAQTASLPYLHMFMMKLAPDLSRPPTTKTYLTHEQFADMEAASTFAYSGPQERMQMKHILDDGGFAALAPRRLQIALLAAQEKRLRAQAIALRPLPSGSTALFYTRAHFQGFEGLRSMGLIEVLKPQIERIRTGDKR